MKIYTINGWGELCRLVESRSSGSGRKGWIYRGQPCNWPLLPGIARESNRKEEDSNELKEFSPESERRLFRNFLRQSNVRINVTPRNELEWLALGQHYRLPTRLLDWTESLFIAAFFACEHGGAKSDGKTKFPAIYAVRDLPEVPFGCDPFAYDGVGVVRPVHLEPRIAAQQGLFTLHGDPTATLNDERVECYLFTEPERVPYMIKLCLDVAGINRNTLFPDLDGLCEHLGWLYKRQRLPDIG